MIEEKVLKSQKSVQVPEERLILKKKTIIMHPESQYFDFESSNVKDFKAYIQTFDETLNKVNQNQLQQLKKKYRFYLSKVQKLQQMKISLQQKYDTMEDYIDNSAPIKQQKESIRFISMISKQTTRRLQQIISKVNKAKDQKKNYEKQIVSLKQLIKKQKNKFFELKRDQMKLKNDMDACQKASKLQSANCTFKNIVQDKLIKKKQKIDSMKQNQSQRPGQTSTRLSCFQVLKIHQQLNEIKQEDAKNKLPQIHPVQTSDIFQHKRRESFGSQTTQQISNKKKHQKNLNISSQIMAKSAAFQTYKNSKIRSQLFAKSKKSIKNKLVINQLQKINKMKQELVKQTQKIQKADMFHIKKKYQEFMNQFGQPIEDENKYSIKISDTNPISHSLIHTVQKHKGLLKDCSACQFNQQKHRISIQKYSFHQQAAETIRSKIGSKNQQNLLISQQQTKKIKELENQRQAFLNLTPQQIISKIVQKQKIGQIMKLMQRQNVYSINNFSRLKILR